MLFNTFTLTYYEAYPYYVGCKVPNPVTDDAGKSVMYLEPGRVVKVEAVDNAKFIVTVAYGCDD